MNSKRTIMILILVLTIGIIGLTLAYFSNSSTVNNIFTTQPYGTTIEETFTSPSNWLPGQEIDKTVVATNTGNVDEAVRISLSESWTTANNGTLNGWITSTGTKSSHLEEFEPSNDERVALINFDNASDWEYSNGYYYYKYKLSPNESTSSLIKSVTFNPKNKLDDTCVETPTTTGRTITCDSSGEDYDDATYTLTFDIETVQYNKYNEAWNLNNAVAISETKQRMLKGLKVNASGAEYSVSTKSDLFVMTHPQTDQTPAQTEYRYIGDNPYNYVYFNCDDLNNQNSNTCEVWRIIGVFDVDDGTGNYEQRIKIVRGSALPDTKQWDNRDTTNEGGWEGTGKNEWVDSLMQTYLNDNGDYYTRTGTAANYGLKANVKTLISDAKYYLGCLFNENNDYGTADAIYLWERGTLLCGSCENNLDKLTWNGKIAIMYPSDLYLVYANGVDAACYANPKDCKYDVDSGKYGMPTTGWVHNSNNLEGQNNIVGSWILSPNHYDNLYLFINSSGGNLGFDGVYDNLAVRPVLYLSSNVKITDGTGESTNPYKLGL